MTEPAFYYDFSSPYSYLAASRIDGLLPGAAWRPIAFGVLIREIGKVPWSLQPGREAEMEAIERRAAQRGLPPLRWPPGSNLDNVLDAARAAGLDADDVAGEIACDETRARLRANTSAALARDVTGVPTVAVGEQLFWGDDRLEQAVAAAA